MFVSVCLFFRVINIYFVTRFTNYHPMNVSETVLCHWKGRELLIPMNADWDNSFIGLFYLGNRFLPVGTPNIISKAQINTVYTFNCLAPELVEFRLNPQWNTKLAQ